MLENSNKFGKFYITTAIPYANAKPHIGHALEFVQADVLARYHRIKGNDVLLLSGSDDNALKNVQAAEKAGVAIQDFVEINGALFQELSKKFNVSLDIFQKGSDRERHYPASQKLWELCDATGDIYQKAYEGLYCVGCELFYTKEELDRHGECFTHPGRKLETVSEENYFFRLSKYQNELITLIDQDALKIFPASRKNEVLAFLREPLQDISISRSNARAKNWGVPIPGDDTQRMYVWFDALNIYQSGVGFGWDETQYEKWWPADAHLIGKDIIRFHAVYWPAFLLSAKLPLPKSLLVHGFVTTDGQKMSKTLGNTIDPFEIIEKYGTDPVRYYLLREIPSGEDGDFSIKKLEDRHNGDLANGLGNLIARVATLGEKISPIAVMFKNDIEKEIDQANDQAFASYEKHIEEFRLHEALGTIWQLVSFADKYINDTKPWSITDEEKLRLVILNASYCISSITNLLGPFLPQTAGKIREQILFEDSTVKIKRGAPLFPRLS